MNINETETPTLEVQTDLCAGLQTSVELKTDSTAVVEKIRKVDFSICVWATVVSVILMALAWIYCWIISSL
jgi:hypothetical protein